MAALTVQSVLPASTAITKSAATVTTGDTFPLDTQTTVFVENGSGGSITVTVTSKRSVSEGYAVADKTFTVAAGVTRAVALDPAVYNDATTAVATVVCSSVTTVNVWATRR